jgi:hypothetical protein
LRAIVPAASRNRQAERHDDAQQQPTNPNILTNHDCHPISPPGIRGAEFLHFCAEIKGVSLKSAFNKLADRTYSDARKICANNRFIRVLFASCAGIMSQSFARVPAMQAQYQLSAFISRGSRERSHRRSRCVSYTSAQR